MSNFTYEKDWDVYLSNGEIIHVKAVNSDMATGIAFEDNIDWINRDKLRITKVVPSE